MTTAGLDLAVTDERLEDAVRAGLAQVEQRLHDAVRSADRLAEEAGRHLILAGGKRVRPMLTLLAAHLGAGPVPEVIDAAAVVELTHLASLYHDDVMDSAPMRRGAPSAHELWGNTVAILVGDVLFARASLIVAGLGVEAVRIQARTFERLCLGQLHETTGPAPGEDPVAFYLQVLSDKTGALIATSGRFGALFAGCPPETVDVLVRYGEQVGVAFQLADDVIDLTGDGSQTGKTPGTDLRLGLPTLPVLLARRAAAEGDASAAAVVGLVDGDLTDDARLAAAVSAVREHPVMAAARAEAAAHAQRAIAALDPLPDGPATDALRTFAAAVVTRTS